MSTCILKSIHAYKENSPIGEPVGEDRGVVALTLYS